MSEPRRPRSIDFDNPFLADLGLLCEVLLVRHGEQQFYENIAMGDAVDAPLSPLGERQAAAVGERLAPVRIDAVYASPMRRAHDTGRAIASHHGLTPHLDPDLVEIEPWKTFPPGKGLLDVFSKQELAAIYRTANETRRWDAYPHTEDPEAFVGRVNAAVDRIIDAHPGQRVVIACHGGVINAVLARSLRSDMHNLVKVHHTSITTLRGHGGRRSVLSVNDYQHVLGFQTEVNPLNLH